MPTEITSQSEFDSALAKAGSKLVVVDFHAQWCGPCKAIAPTYESLSRQYAASAHFLKVDVDAVPSVARSHGVSAMPTFLFLRNRATLETLRGANPGKLSQLVQKYAAGGGGGGAGGFPGGGQTLAGSSSAAARRGGGGATAATGPPTSLVSALRGVASENSLPLLILVAYVFYVLFIK